jgi:hypothetical protein
MRRFRTLALLCLAGMIGGESVRAAPLPREIELAANRLEQP